MSSRGSNIIEEIEKEAVIEILKKGYMPLCDFTTWRAISEHYHLLPPVRVDDLLLKADLPPGWSFNVDPHDHRSRIIRDHENIEVGSLFYSVSLYKPAFGSVSFYPKRLKELGILM